MSLILLNKDMDHSEIVESLTIFNLESDNNFAKVVKHYLYTSDKGTVLTDSEKLGIYRLVIDELAPVKLESKRLKKIFTLLTDDKPGKILLKDDQIELLIDAFESLILLYNRVIELHRVHYSKAEDELRRMEQLLDNFNYNREYIRLVMQIRIPSLNEVIHQRYPCYNIYDLIENLKSSLDILHR